MLEFRIARKQLQHCEWVECADPPLRTGEVRFALERFALSANNITYADLGEKFSYWQFFPTEPGFGLLPIWGFSRVVETNNSEFPIGMRAYGYWPLAQHCELTPQFLGGASFADKSAQRASLPAVYQLYQRWQHAPDALAEARYALLRPLYMTAWLCADFLRDSAFFEASSVLVLSASSKTALALGAALKRLAPEIQTVGCTSAANLAFVRSSDCFDAVHSYEEIEQLSKSATALVDVAGSPSLLARVHQHFSDALVYSGVLGISHRGELAPENRLLPGAKPQLFFAPNQVKKRVQEHGPGWIEQHSRADWKDFLQSSTKWLEVDVATDFAQIQASYLSLLAGQAGASRGLGFELSDVSPSR
jgi:Protein of unknown function (DUF2855)